MSAAGPHPAAPPAPHSQIPTLSVSFLQDFVQLGLRVRQMGSFRGQGLLQGEFHIPWIPASTLLFPLCYHDAEEAALGPSSVKIHQILVLVVPQQQETPNLLTWLFPVDNIPSCPLFWEFPPGLTRGVGILPAGLSGSATRLRPSAPEREIQRPAHNIRVHHQGQAHPGQGEARKHWRFSQCHHKCCRQENPCLGNTKTWYFIPWSLCTSCSPSAAEAEVESLLLNFGVP